MKQLFHIFEESLSINNLKHELSLDESVTNFNGAMNVYFKQSGDGEFGRRYNGQKVVVKTIDASGITNLKKLGSLIKPVFNDLSSGKAGTEDAECVAWLEINDVDCVGFVQNFSTVSVYPNRNVQGFNYQKNLKVTAAAQIAAQIIAATFNFKTDQDVKDFFKNKVKIQYKIVKQEKDNNYRKNRDRIITNKDRSENIAYSNKLKAAATIYINKLGKSQIKYDKSQLIVLDQFIKENITKSAKGLFTDHEYKREVDRAYEFKLMSNGVETDNQLDVLSGVFALLYLCYIVNRLKNDKWKQKFDTVIKAIVGGKQLTGFNNATRLISELDTL